MDNGKRVQLFINQLEKRLLMTSSIDVKLSTNRKKCTCICAFENVRNLQDSRPFLKFTFSNINMKVLIISNL